MMHYEAKIHVGLASFFSYANLLNTVPYAVSYTHLDVYKRQEWTLNRDGKRICTKISVDSADRKETKNRLKLALYSMIEKGTGKSLPWGTLSGIRPTKIAMKCIEDGMSDKETYDYLKKTYLASDEKIDLSIGIAKREKALLDKVDYDNGYSLYIGCLLYTSRCV